MENLNIYYLLYYVVLMFFHFDANESKALADTKKPNCS